MRTGKQNTEDLLRHGCITQHMRRSVVLIRARIRKGVRVTQQQRDFVARIDALLLLKGRHDKKDRC